MVNKRGTFALTVVKTTTMNNMTSFQMKGDLTNQSSARNIQNRIRENCKCLYMYPKNNNLNKEC